MGSEMCIRDSPELHHVAGALFAQGWSGNPGNMLEIAYFVARWRSHGRRKAFDFGHLRLAGRLCEHGASVVQLGRTILSTTICGSGCLSLSAYRQCARRQQGHAPLLLETRFHTRSRRARSQLFVFRPSSIPKPPATQLPSASSSCDTKGHCRPIQTIEKPLCDEHKRCGNMERAVGSDWGDVLWHQDSESE